MESSFLGDSLPHYINNEAWGIMTVHVYIGVSKSDSPKALLDTDDKQTIRTVVTESPILIFWETNDSTLFTRDDEASTSLLFEQHVLWMEVYWWNLPMLILYTPVTPAKPTRNQQKPQSFQWIGQLSATDNVAEDTVKPVGFMSGSFWVRFGMESPDLGPIYNRHETDWKPIISTMLET